MRAVDATVVVGYLTGDDRARTARVREAVEAGPVYVPTTVLLEAERVLRRACGYGPGEVARALRAFAGLPQVRVENADLLAEALDRAEAGMDFADALHLGAAAGCESMLTVDRRFIAAAAGARVRVVEP